MFITNYNIPWSLAALLLRNTCHFQDGCLNWKLHSSLFFLGKEFLHYNTQCPLKCCSIPLINIFLYKLKYLLKSCSITFEKHMPFSRCLFQLETTFIFEVFLKENFFITIHNTPWSVAALFSDLLKITCLFQNVCFNWDMHHCVTKKCNSFLGNVYNFVWKNFFITIQIVPWSVAAILLKHVCLFHEDWFNWEM